MWRLKFNRQHNFLWICWIDGEWSRIKFERKDSNVNGRWLSGHEIQSNPIWSNPTFEQRLHFWFQNSYRWYLLPHRWLNAASTDGIYMVAGHTRGGVRPPFPPNICRNTALHNICTVVHPYTPRLLIHLSTPVTPLICLKTSFQPAGKGGNERLLMCITLLSQYITLLSHYIRYYIHVTHTFGPPSYPTSVLHNICEYIDVVQQ